MVSGSFSHLRTLTQKTLRETFLMANECNVHGLDSFFASRRTGARWWALARFDFSY